MTAIKDFDLQEERDKLQSQLALLDDILRKKVEFEAGDKKLLDTKADLQQLSMKLATLEEDLAVQRAEIERDTKDHEAKKQQWKEKSDKFDCILFKDDISPNTSEPESDDLNQLKIASNWPKKIPIYLRSCFTFASSRRVFHLGNRLSMRQNYLCQLRRNYRKTWKRSPYCWSRFSRRLRQNSIEEKVKVAFSKGGDLMIRRLNPLATAGGYIRGRKLEWQKSTKNKGLVELGDKPSHYGMALADAALPKLLPG